jgi:hypothetical protein
MRAQFMKRCHSCIVRNQRRFRASRPRNLELGVLFSSPLVPSCARGYHKPNTQKSKMRFAVARAAGWTERPCARLAKLGRRNHHATGISACVVVLANAIAVAIREILKGGEA